MVRTTEPTTGEGRGERGEGEKRGIRSRRENRQEVALVEKREGKGLTGEGSIPACSFAPWPINGCCAIVAKECLKAMGTKEEQRDCCLKECDRMLNVKDEGSCGQIKLAAAQSRGRAEGSRSQSADCGCSARTNGVEKGNEARCAEKTLLGTKSR